MAEEPLTSPPSAAPTGTRVVLEYRAPIAVVRRPRAGLALVFFGLLLMCGCGLVLVLSFAGMSTLPEIIPVALLSIGAGQIPVGVLVWRGSRPVLKAGALALWGDAVLIGTGLVRVIRGFAEVPDVLWSPSVLACLACLSALVAVMAGLGISLWRGSRRAAC